MTKIVDKDHIIIDDVAYESISNPSGMCHGCAFFHGAKLGNGVHKSCDGALDMLWAGGSGCSELKRADKNSVKWIRSSSQVIVKEVNDTRSEDEKNICDVLLG